MDYTVQLEQNYGENFLMAKTDREDAFRIIPGNSVDYHLFVFSRDNVFYFDICLPIGASSSCQIFNRVSEALQWVMQSSYNASAMSPILNDFFFIGPADSQSCKNDLTNFLYHCKTIGVPIKMSKIQTPTTSIIFMSLKLTHAKWKHVFLLKKLIRLENTF